MSNLLAGVTVLDLSSYGTGPYATWLLHGLGARILKVEGPKGDMMRQSTTKYSNISYPFVLYNRGSQSVVLDMKTDAGRDLVKKLAQKVDVLVENFVPGTLDGWGLSYETLSSSNKRLIYASIVGFGRDSKWAQLPAYDAVIQAMGGAMPSTGFPDSPPTVCGSSYMDIVGPPHLATGILASLYSRERTGHGERISVAMRDVAACVPMNLYNIHHESGKVPRQSGNRLVGRAPWDTYRAKDGYVYIAASNDKHAAGVFNAMGRTDLTQLDRFATPYKRWMNREELTKLIEEWMSARTREEACRALWENDVPTGPVLDIRDVLNDEDLNTRKVFHEIDQPGIGRIKVFSSPIRVGTETPESLDFAPALGEHTEQVLKEFLG